MCHQNAQERTNPSRPGLTAVHNLGVNPHLFHAVRRDLVGLAFVGIGLSEFVDYIVTRVLIENFQSIHCAN